jgi:HEAT repeat protein
VSALVLVLRDSDETVRVAALEAVGRLGDASAVSSVAAVLDSDEPAVRAAAAGALARLATPAALGALIAELGRSDADAEPVLRALSIAGPPALPALRACLDARSAPLSLAGCAAALGEVGDESDTPRLADALGRGRVSPMVALPALGKLGGQAAVPTVLEALASPDENIRRAALGALGRLLDPKHPDGRAVDPLLSAFRARRSTPTERTLILRLIGRTGARRVGPELARIAVEATVPATVTAAVTALGDLGAGPWESVLVAKLDDDDGEVRTAAALALGRAASERTLASLLVRLERASEQDRGALGLALPGAASKSRDPSVLARLVALFTRSSDEERDPLIEAIAETPGSGAAVARLAREPDAKDRSKLAEALAGHHDASATLSLLGRDAEPAVRANAAWSLGFGDGTAFGELEQLLADSDGRVAANAAVGLGRVAALSQRDVRAPLCARVTDPRAVVRASALTGLRLAAQRCDGPSVVRLLGSDMDARVRRAAAELLVSQPGDKTEAAALAHCAAEDETNEVATLCAARATRAPAERAPVLVFVVPTGGDEPLPSAPFALRFADDTERFGAADRRGAVYERLAPEGALELGAVPGTGD